MGTKIILFWRNVLWSDETKIELFGHNDHCYVWRNKGEACKSRTPSQPQSMGWHHHVVGVGCFAAGGSGALHKKYGNMRMEKYIESTSQDISQDVKAWSQMGLPNRQ
jgi:hypothetical protein